MEGQRLTVALLLLFMISAATACKVNDVFCFENCDTSNVTQFCNCVVDEVVARNDSESLSNATLVQEFEDQAASILKGALGCDWCCTFIIIRQNVQQVPNPPGCLNQLAYATPCNCATSETSRSASSAQRAGDSTAANSASGTTATVFIHAILTGMSFMMLFVF